jgi:hypothetical protein
LIPRLSKACFLNANPKAEVINYYLTKVCLSVGHGAPRIHNEATGYVLTRQNCGGRGYSGTSQINAGHLKDGNIKLGTTNSDRCQTCSASLRRVPQNKTYRQSDIQRHLKRRYYQKKPTELSEDGGDR